MPSVKSPEKLSARDFGEEDKIVVEKDETEELLPGWKTEVKVRKTGSGTNKLDRYYTDPVTGYVFRSLKDVQRYLKTGELGRLATKPKDNTCPDKDNEDQKLHMEGKHSSSLVESESVGNLVESTIMEDRTCVSENASETFEKIVEASDGSLPDAFSSPQSEKSRHKRPPENESEGYRTRSGSSKKRKYELTQRVSKRLAGINIGAPLWSPPEPKTRQATRLAGITIIASSLSLPEPKKRQPTRVTGMETEASSPSLPEPKTLQATRYVGIEFDASATSPPEPKTHQATKKAEIKVDSATPPPPPEPKTRQAKQQAGIKVDSATTSPPEPKTRQAKQQAGINVDSATTSPPEPKTRQAKQQARIKVDSATTSPPEPKTRQAKQQAGINIDSATSPPPEPKTRQATQKAGIRVDSATTSLPEPKTRQATPKIGIKVGASTTPPPEPKTRQATQQAGIKVDASGLSSSEPKTRQARRLAGMETVALPQSLPEPKTRQAARLAGLEIDASRSSLPEPKIRQDTRVARMENGASPPSLLDRKPHLATTRPSGNRTDASSLEVRTTRARHVRKAEALKENGKKSTFREVQVEGVKEITDKHYGNVEKPEYRQESSIILPPVSQQSHDNKFNMLEFQADKKQELRIISPPAIPSIPKQHYNENKMGPAVLTPVSYPTTEQQAPPTVVPPVNLYEKQVLPIVNPPVSNPIPPESSTNFSMNDLWTDPCIEFAVKTLTGAIPFGDFNKANNFPPSPLEAPLEEIWTDPCIEFAVKTLTGAIPIEEDPCVQDYLQQNRSASTSDPQAVHSFFLPDVGRNFCQTEVLSKHYETSHNKQQDSVVPTLGNGSLQMAGNSNNNVVPQGSNGQCTRPRLF